ncbi:DUF2695 domain-containing protein [Flavobacterium sp. GN10]|uniref:DUF2695 domain-containing protein n=1 Tax=Flavobacterium tagetis TaxID=2801336 RepID=A0ABS1KA26_9FLAO|nr:DUF2695 domain-containing protein [Flavobacterium tagetis]MBL0736366.1 DUF2695 domain-containing protein [Flavobacterium tagetis]
MDKKKRKEILDKLYKEKLIEFRQSLPFDENIFPKLFDYLDNELIIYGCNHTSLITETFLQKNGILNVIEVIEWLAKNGGYCDCEILANVEDLFDYLNPPKINTTPKKEVSKQKINSLETDFGFCIERVPSPWNLIETTATNSKEYFFQFGKNNNCTVNLHTHFSLFENDNDEHWINLWIDETNLNYNLENLTVERLKLGDYTVFIAKTKDWTPVKVWCANKKNSSWLLKMNTELSRHKGDIKELEKLLSSIL